MNRTILVVDDSPTIVKFVSFALRNRGFTVITACDGMDAVEKMSGLDHRVDLVITDINMPNLDGYGLIETIRQNEEHRETPIIILSSQEGEEDKNRGLQAGASSYLVKPFKSDLLISEIGKYF